MVKTNTIAGVSVGETEMETLPVTADLAVSEQKTRGEATGKVANVKEIYAEAIAKALGQEPPSANNPDVLVGQHAFTEVDGTDLKVVLTGYPAYYTNFRTATKTDSLRLNMFNSGAPSIAYRGEKSDGKRHEDSSEWYFSVKYQFGDGFGWGIGAGKSWPSNLLQGDFIFGLEIEEMGFLSPWKNEKDIEWFGLGGSLNAGGIYGELPYNLKLVYGLSAGFWFSEYRYESIYNYGYGYYGTYHSADEDYAILFGPFAKVRWHGLEAGFRLFFGSDTDFQFALGFTI